MGAGVERSPPGLLGLPKMPLSRCPYISATDIGHLVRVLGNWYDSGGHLVRYGYDLVGWGRMGRLVGEAIR